MKFNVYSFLICMIFCGQFSASSSLASDSKPVVFFDMGDVIVDTHNMNDIHYFDSSKEIIAQVKSASLKTGLIINIPASFGGTCAQKFEKLKNFISTSWRKNSPAFKWQDFDYIFLPPSDALKKPHPYLFAAALTKACPNPMVYMGEDQAEVQAAAKLGIAAHWVGVEGDPEFLTIEEILNQTAQMPANCDFSPIWSEMGVPNGFHGCLFEASSH